MAEVKKACEIHSKQSGAVSGAQRMAEGSVVYIRNKAFIFADSHDFRCS